MITTKVKHFPKNILTNKEIIGEALNRDCLRALIIPIKSIVLARWLRLQCQYGCDHFGQRLTCPPYSPTADEFSEILLDYNRALLIEAKQSEQVMETITGLENILKNQGSYKAFGLGANACSLCDTCTTESHCEYPAKARPTLRAFGVDVPATLSNVGWDIQINMDYCKGGSIGLILMD
jgi:predicted metal-binding protein